MSRCAVLSFGHRRATNSHFCKSEHVPLLLTDLFLVYATLLMAFIMFVCHSASCHLNTYKLFLFVRREPGHLLFVGLHLLLIIQEVSHYKPKTTKTEIRLLKHKAALSGLYI